MNKPSRNILFNLYLIIYLIIINVVSFNYYLNDDSEYKYISLLVSIISICFFICLFQVTHIFEDTIKIVYPLRFFYKPIQEIQYHQITKLICYVPKARGDSPKIKITLKEQNKNLSIRYDNINRAQLYNLLLFLKSKINIVEVSGTDNNSIEDLKNSHTILRNVLVAILCIILVISFLL